VGLCGDGILHKSMLWTRFIVLILSGQALWSQGAYVLNLNPPAVSAGGQSFTLNVALSVSGSATTSPTPKSTWTVRWNGSPRPTVLDASQGEFGSLDATISKADIAQPGFAEITILDQATGVVYPITGWIMVTADLYVSDFAYDSVRNRFYVSVPAASSRPGAPAESIVSVDTSTGAMLASVNVGSKPTLLAISSDCSFLYVYISGGAEIARISLSTFTLDQQIPLGTQIVIWMAVEPGSPRTLAVSQSATGGGGTLAIYDDALPRPQTAQANAYRFVVSDPQTIVAGGYSAPIGIWKVSASGVTAGGQLPNAENDTPLDSADGWILGSSGGMFDLAGLRQSQRADLGGLGAFVPGRSRVLMLGAETNGSGSGALAIGAFDESTMTALGRITVTNPYNEYPTQPLRMLIWGTDGVAFIANQQLFFGHTELAAAAPTVSAASTVNAATFTSGSVAPGEILSIFGSNLGLPAGRSLEFAEPRQVSSILGGTQVWFDGSTGALLYAGAGQINVVAPFEISGKSSTRMQVWYQGIPSAFVTLPVSPAAPGIFTQDSSGTGAGIVLNADYTLNSPANPAPAGSVVSLYANGGGTYSPSLEDGQQDVYADNLTAKVQVSLNGTSALVSYAGSAPGLVAGVVQINFQIPAGFPSSSAVTIQLNIGGKLSPTGVTLSVR
jgi:uncharacterized protein (TIGR03437 family)